MTENSKWNEKRSMRKTFGFILGCVESKNEMW